MINCFRSEGQTTSRNEVSTSESKSEEDDKNEEEVIDDGEEIKHGKKERKLKLTTTLTSGMRQKKKSVVNNMKKTMLIESRTCKRVEIIKLLVIFRSIKCTVRPNMKSTVMGDGENDLLRKAKC